MANRKDRQTSWIKHIDFTLIDIACLVCSFVLAYWLKFGDLSVVDSSKWRALLLMLLVLDLVITLAIEPYSGILRRGYWADIGASLKLALVTFLSACVVFYLLKIGDDYSREMSATTFAVYLIASLLLKAGWKKLLLSRLENRPPDSVKRVILVTPTAKAEEAEKLVMSDDMHAHDVVAFGLVDSDKEVFDGRPASTPDGLLDLATRCRADEIIVVASPESVNASIYEALIEDGIRVSFAVSESLGISSETQRIGRVGVMKTLDLERYSFGAGQMLYLPIKRMFDIAFGIVGCMGVLILVAFVKLACLISGDTHPVFYKQVRIGLRGKPFYLWKLRSMVWNADEVLDTLLEDPELRRQWERDQKLEDDPRITKVGGFLRRTSLDELPQFFNVLKGDMSVVGPRPLVPGELEAHGGRQLYNKVRPGITGWWGCNGRSSIGYRERLELEYHYVKNCSLYLDLLCVLRTFAAVLKRDGSTLNHR